VETYRALSGFLGGSRVVERGHEGRCPDGVAEEEPDFLGIQPDTSTGLAVVKLDLIQLHGNHRVVADRAIHSYLPCHVRATEGYVNVPSGFGQ